MFLSKHQFISKLIYGGIVGLTLSFSEASAQSPKQITNSKYRITATSPADPKRLSQIAAMLPDQPRGMGLPYTARTEWDNLLRSGNFDPIIKAADEATKVPLPALTDEIYFSFFNSNDSETSKKLVRKRIILFDALVWAECLKNTGQYMPAIESALADLLTQKSWNFPAEDRKKTNFEGKQYTINLSASAYAHDVAEALYLLGDKLKPELRKKAMAVLYEKIFIPTMQGIKNNNKNDEFTSLTNTTGNHNAVTIAGVTGAALAVIADKNERAHYVVMAEKYITNTLAGFLDDGYCSEGLGYYNYGFKHYVLLRETLLQATNGQIDLFKDPKVQIIARYVPNIEITKDVYPTIGDCNMNEKPSKFLMYYLNKTLDLGLKTYDTFKYNSLYGPPLQEVYMVFPNSATKAQAGSQKGHQTPIRSYFQDAGVITVRPKGTKTPQLGATFKGGHNNEHHNHNDVGSYTVVLGKELLSGDPGLATYTSKTFSPHRYSIKTIASYGHPVPLVGGKEQRTGKDALAKILRTDFTETADNVVMDISSAYEVPELKKLLRSFVYKRGEGAMLEVGDEFEFSSPQQYESAIITRAKWTRISENTIELAGVKERLLLTIKAPGSFTIQEEIIKEAPKPYTRLGIKLNNPMSAGKVTISYQPISKK